MGKLLYNGWHAIEEIECQIKGKTVTREKLHIKSAVAGIVTDSHGKIALVRQYRPIVDQYTYEIPAGVLDDPALTPYGIMLQELKEECAIADYDIETCELVDSIPSFYQVVGSSNSSTTLYRITLNDEMLRSYVVHDSEVESVHWVDLEELEDMVYAGLIVDGKTLLAHFILKEELL